VNDSEHVPNLRVIPTTVPNELSHWLAQGESCRATTRNEGLYASTDWSRTATTPGRNARNSHEATFPKPALAASGPVAAGSRSIWRRHLRRVWMNTALSNGKPVTPSGLPIGSTTVSSLVWGHLSHITPLSEANRSWASRYLLVHSLAHILINQLVFECGYSTASLRERLYISVDRQHQWLRSLSTPQRRFRWNLGA